jgi:cell division septation protein DedD
MGLIVAFSWGFEKGKKLNIRTVSAKAPAPIQAQLSQPEITAQETEKQPKKEEQKRFFTVQVATFKLKESAKKEIERLQNLGYHPFMIDDGGYVRVCVGKFPQYRQASAYLSKLRKIYDDCFINEVK